MVRITVRDRFDSPAAGAEISFTVDGIPQGSVTLGLNAATIELQNPHSILEVVADYAQQRQTVVLSPGLDDHTIRFTSSALSKSYRPAIARCPDGSVGQPCVDCMVNGSIVRICV